MAMCRKRDSPNRRPGEVAIGIDLGTTYSCAAVWRNDAVEIIPNDQGKRTTPSCVAFTDNQRLVGDAAFNQIAINPANTVFDAKRLIGRTFNDPEVQNDVRLWPFRVVEGDRGKPMIVLRYRGEEKRFAAEEISSMVLGKLRDQASAYLGTEVKNAVITVPAYFNESQRQATVDAGTIAGLNVMRIINEPTAAAVFYGLDKKSGGQSGVSSVLIFDLGGGTLDVSILEIEEGEIRVKATAGDTHLGGEDFDHRLVEFFVNEFRRKHGKDIAGNPRALRRLRTACENAKRSLCHSEQAVLEIDSLHDGIDFHETLKRTKFEDLNMELFGKCMQTVENCLRDADLTPQRIDDVVLVGGSTRILKIQELLRELFGGRELSRCINPDEAVASGAALQAAMLNETVRGLNLRDVTPLSLGVETRGGIMSVVVPRNTSVPTVKEKSFTTSHDWDTVVAIKIFEGERSVVSRNNLLGSCSIVDIPPAPAGLPKFTVRFSVDEEGMLEVTAMEEVTRNGAETVITNDRGELDEAEIERMVRDAERYREEDKEAERRVVARNELEKFAYKLQISTSNPQVAERMSEDERAQVQLLVVGCLQWLGNNEMPDLNQVELMRTALEDLWTPIVTKIFGPSTSGGSVPSDMIPDTAR